MDNVIFTDNFKKWFGDWENDPNNASKMVDKNGKPQIYYHFTNSEFNSFDKDYIIGGGFGTGFHFCNHPIQHGKNKLICYLNVRNPYIMGDINKLENLYKLYDILGYSSEDDKETIKNYWEYYFEDKNTPNGKGAMSKINREINPDEEIDLAIELADRGYDGIIAYNVSGQPMDNNGKYLYNKKIVYEQEIIVFEPNQIKSATNNNGNFSTESDNIYESILPKRTYVFAVADEIGEVIENTKNKDIEVVKQIRDYLSKKYKRRFNIVQLGKTFEDMEIIEDRLEEDDCCSVANCSSNISDFAPEHINKIVDPSGQLLESTNKSVAFTFGRMCLPQYGYIKLWEKLASIPADSHFIYTSHSYDKKNPISYETKSAVIKYLLKAYNIDAQFIDTESRTIIDIAIDLSNEGYRNIIFIGGSDRVDEVTNLLKKYNGISDRQGRSYHFDSIEGVSGGDRDPDSDSVEGMSGTKMRQFVIDDDFDSFKDNCPVKDPYILNAIWDEAKNKLR